MDAAQVKDSTIASRLRQRAQQAEQSAAEIRHRIQEANRSVDTAVGVLKAVDTTSSVGVHAVGYAAGPQGRAIAKSKGLVEGIAVAVIEKSHERGVADAIAAAIAKEAMSEVTGKILGITEHGPVGRPTKYVSSWLGNPERIRDGIVEGAKHEIADQVAERVLQSVRNAQDRFRSQIR